MADRRFEEDSFFRGRLTATATKLFTTEGEVAALASIILSNPLSTKQRATIYLQDGADIAVSQDRILLPNIEIPPNGLFCWKGYIVLGRDEADSSKTEAIWGQSSGNVNAFIDGAILEEITTT